ncbi:MAG: PDZ domain-containing protein [Ruminococcaceae bacterium]|nr:PDZ domain-containing protein [Oscillospiraceae bacterium]
MFKKRFSLPTLSVLLILSVLLTFQITFVTMREEYDRKLKEQQLESPDEAEKLAHIIQLIRNYSIYDIDPNLPADKAIAAYLSSTGDRYAYYYTAKEYAKYLAANNGNQSGIGITVIDCEQGLTITSVKLSSPAEKAGLKAGDCITDINETTLAGKDYAAKTNLLIGKTTDTFVLTVLRDNNELVFTLKPAVYESPSVIGSLLPDGKTGLVRIENFINDTEELFKQITSNLKKKGAKQFIYDLRGNPGGSLTSVVAVLDYLLPKGIVVTLENYDGSKNEYTSDDNSFDYPAVILVNKNTASAGELFASCMRDYNAAILMGETTYGKGVAQSFFTLPDGSAIKFTTAKYYSPHTKNYDGVGLSPDISISCPTDLTDFAHSVYETDPQMQAAVAHLNKS